MNDLKTVNEFRKNTLMDSDIKTRSSSQRGVIEARKPVPMQKERSWNQIKPKTMQERQGENGGEVVESGRINAKSSKFLQRKVGKKDRTKRVAYKAFDISDIITQTNDDDYL